MGDSEASSDLRCLAAVPLLDGGGNVLAVVTGHGMGMEHTGWVENVNQMWRELYWSILI